MFIYDNIRLGVKRDLPEWEGCKGLETAGVDGDVGVDPAFERFYPGVREFTPEIELYGIGHSYFNLCPGGIMSEGRISIEGPPGYRLAGGIIVVGVDKSCQVIIITGRKRSRDK